MPARGIAFSLAEDRLYCETGLRLAIPSSASTVRIHLSTCTAQLSLPNLHCGFSAFPRSH